MSDYDEGLTEEICDCDIFYGGIENKFGQIVCEHCGRELPEL